MGLSNQNVIPQVRSLYQFICDNYKMHIISGQQEGLWDGSEQTEFEYIEKVTGKLPAIRGLDFMADDFEGSVRRAKEWHARGGIVSICWHCGPDFTKGYTESQQQNIADWDAFLTEGTPEYEKLLWGIDRGARALLELQEAGIPVLWRPFHEFDGDWFWWNRGGAENFKKLWKVMYDRYTNHFKLNNLIWVLGYTHLNKDYIDWFPGWDCVDIIGADSYIDGPNTNLYEAMVEIAGYEQPICFHECGRIPTPQQLTSEGALWSWFMTWHTVHILQHNDPEDLKQIYTSEYVITLDELPALATYPY